MKTFSAIAALGLISLAQAQEQCAASAALIPSCALDCIQSAGSGVGCAPGDFACPCSSSQAAAIASAAFGCVLSACGPVTGLAVQSAGAAVCECVATAAPASTTAEATSAEATTSSAAPISTATQSSIVATTSISLPTAPYPTATAGTTAAPSGSSPAGPGPAGGPGAVPFTGGASMVVGSLAGILGALLFVMVAL
ncbi:MAG: hypothetical protein Q9184_004276 [Pyrenodesmia sp. 2 TL-2023]